MHPTVAAYGRTVQNIYVVRIYLRAAGIVCYDFDVREKPAPKLSVTELLGIFFRNDRRQIILPAC